jgi:hypothetical protein
LFRTGREIFDDSTIFEEVGGGTVRGDECGDNSICI